MVLPQFEYLAPKTIGEACNLFLELGSTARVMAGATDLIPPNSRPIFMSAWATAWCQTAVNPVTISSRPSPSARRRASYPSAREYRQPRLWTAM